MPEHDDSSSGTDLAAGGACPPVVATSRAAYPLLAADDYLKLRAWMAADPEWASQIEWSEGLTRPASADVMARELIFVICNSGMKAAVARGIFERVMPVLEAGGDAHSAFGHVGKAGAMNKIWAGRAGLYNQFLALPDSDVLAWCEQIPWIGPITRAHAAKNLGVLSVAKPDRWLVRLAEASGESVQAMCERVAAAGGDSVATADLVLWWSLAHGVLRLPKGSGQLRLVPPPALSNA